MRERLRLKHYSLRTEQAYVHWVKRYIHFHGVRHPSEMGKVEIEAFLTSLAVDRLDSASTQTQALSALLFLFKEVLGQEFPWLTEVSRAKRSTRLPLVLTRDEARSLLASIPGFSRRGRSLVGPGVARMGRSPGRHAIGHDHRECSAWR